MRSHQHGPTVELVGLQQQRALPRLSVHLAVGPIDDAAATAVIRPGVVCGLSSKVLGAPRGPRGRGLVAGINIICKNRPWVQTTSRMGRGCGTCTKRWVLDQRRSVWFLKRVYIEGAR